MWRHKYCAMPFFEIQDGGHVFCTFSKFKAFLTQFVLENVRNWTKTVLVTLIALDTRNFSKNSNVIVYELLLRLYTEKTRFVILNFFKILLFILKKKLSFYFVPFICRFFKFRNVSKLFFFDWWNFCKNSKFWQLWRHYDVMMTSYANWTTSN